MNFDVLIVNPNPLLNLLYPGDFQPGALNRVQGLSVVAEGKGVNVARVLARHGWKVALTGFAGGHSGAWLRELARAEGVHDACVETVAPLRVGFMASGRGDSHPTTVIPAGFAVTEQECQALSRRVESLLGAARLVIASGSTPHPTADSLYAELLALCARAQTPCWLDAYGPAMSRALAAPIPPPALCKPNRQEFKACEGWERVAELHVTDGEAPIEVSCRREGHWRVVPPSVRQVNPVGCGDCYLAGLAHAWLSGWDWPRRLDYAAAAGAANAMRQDVAMIEVTEIAPLLGLTQLQRLGE